MWAALPEGSDEKFDNAVTMTRSQVPEGYDVFVILPNVEAAKNIEGAAKHRAKEAFGEAFEKNKEVKFHPDRMETWHMRTIPGHGHCISAHPWETHPNYSGPEDQRVFVYVPQLVEERLVEEARKADAEAAKARIQAKADADKKDVDAEAAPVKKDEFSWARAPTPKKKSTKRKAMVS